MPELSYTNHVINAFYPQGGQFDAKYILLFYYYGGMVYSCLHLYPKALLFYTVVCGWVVALAVPF